MKTSWETVTDWYDKIVGGDGHYYHQKLILPGVLRLLKLKENSVASILDLACGQGILARSLPKNVQYLGVDASTSLIQAAGKYQHRPNQHFISGDVTQPLDLSNKNFTHGTIILALQNIADPLAVFKNFYKHLDSEGKLVIVINHPCFRIPRQSSWQIDQTKQMQYRRIERYFSPLKIPIQTHPGKNADSGHTLSFHHPLSAYVAWLKESGFVIEDLEEWCSDKISTGKNAKMENRSRQEFPLFLALLAKKKIKLIFYNNQKTL